MAKLATCHVHAISFALRYGFAYYMGDRLMARGLPRRDGAFPDTCVTHENVITHAWPLVVWDLLQRDFVRASWGDHGFACWGDIAERMPEASD